MTPVKATMEIIRTLDKQIVVRGIFYGNKLSLSEAQRKFDTISNLFAGQRAFEAVNKARVYEKEDQCLYLQVYDILEDSLRVDEVIDWARDLAARYFMTPQQHLTATRRTAI